MWKIYTQTSNCTSTNCRHTSCNKSNNFITCVVADTRTVCLSAPLQLREMLTQTISHYVELFACSNMLYLPRFRLQLCLEAEQMEFFPSLTDLETALLSPVHTIANAMSNVPDIQVYICIYGCPFVVKNVYSRDH